MFFPWKDAAVVEMRPGLTRRTLGVGERAMVGEFRGRAGVVIESHSHPQEQVGYVVSGQMDFEIAGEKRVVGPGDSYVILGGQPHNARFLADSVIMETFSPPRTDYIP